jgi:DNA recombination protein RmuC
MQEFFLYLIGLLLLTQIGLFIFLWQFLKIIKKLKKEEEKENNFALNLIKQDIDQMRRIFEERYGQMSKELGRIQELGYLIKDFQDFLRSPKTRGNIGEQILRDLLEQVLPKNSFNVQYRFQSGEIVDAIIKTNQGIIPIDAKFPLENFQKFQKADNETEKQSTLRDFIRDIKKHVDDIAKKYILPQEGTVDFAVMYVPSEAIYYEIIINQPELLEYGNKRKVYFVSPNSFYYFLKIIMIGLEGAKIEEASRRILKGVKGVQQEALKFAEDLNILLNHIDRAKNASSRVQLNFHKLSGKIDNLSVLEIEKGREKLEEP